MKHLIIYAHPEMESHAQFTLQEVESRLKAQGKNYELIDLYKIKYDPILSTRELTEKGYIPEIVKKHQEMINNSDVLIFIYPIWWNTMPAILKGWFDRTFTSGYAFKYINNIPRGLIHGKSAIIFATTGAPRLFSCIFQGLRWDKIMRKDILRFCGIKGKTYHIGKAFRLTDDNKEKIRKNVKKALG